MIRDNGSFPWKGIVSRSTLKVTCAELFSLNVSASYRWVYTSFSTGKFGIKRLWGAFTGVGFARMPVSACEFFIFFTDYCRFERFPRVASIDSIFASHVLPNGNIWSNTSLSLSVSGYLKSTAGSKLLYFQVQPDPRNASDRLLYD